VPDEPTTDDEGEGEVVPPIVDYTPEEVDPDPVIVPSTPESDDGSSIINDGPTYPAPGEG
jgi:hypothetical protein